MHERVGNVDIEAKPAERARQFWQLLGQALAIVDVGVAPEVQARARRFMLHVAWHEGGRLLDRMQKKGPARSFFQLEAHRAKDGVLYARQKGWLGRLVALAAGPITEAGLSAEGDALPSYDPEDPNTSAKFPPGNMIESQLRTFDPFGVAVARICLRKIPAPLPEGAKAEADYWYEHWKVNGGDADVLKRTFVAECAEVEQLLSDA